MKRLRVTKRDIRMLICEFIVPIAMIIASLALMNATFIADQSPQELSYNLYI